MTNSMLQMIANPATANIGERFNKGVDRGRKRYLQDIALQRSEEDRQYKLEARRVKEEERQAALAEKAKLDAMKSNMLNSYNTGTPAKTRDLMMEYGIETAKDGKALLTLMKGNTEQAVKASAGFILGASQEEDPAKVDAMLSQAINSVKPGTPFHTILSNMATLPPEEKSKAIAEAVEYSVRRKLVEPSETAESADQYEGIETQYETYLRAHKKPVNAETYNEWKKDKAKAAEAARKQPTTRPHMKRIMGEGYVPTQRMTETMMDSFEAAAEYAEANGKPFSVEDMYDYEFNAQKNRAKGRTSGSRLVVARSQNIKTAYGLLDDMKKSADKVDFSKYKGVGMVQQFVKGQLNDPDLTEYMTQRADALFVLGNALKQNGLTDKSIEVEEEAFNPTLSVPAFNAWLKVQTRALDRAAKEMNEDYKSGIKGSTHAPKKITFMGFE